MLYFFYNFLEADWWSEVYLECESRWICTFTSFIFAAFVHIFKIL